MKKNRQIKERYRLVPDYTKFSGITMVKQGNGSYLAQASNFPVHKKIVSGKHKKIPKYKPGRVCEVSMCGTILSIYNSGKKCFAHSKIKLSGE